jgi:type VI secretion system ImpC/EvpB family protein
MTESMQNALRQIRPPRVRITYDIQTGDTIEKRELPFLIAILADLSGDRADPDAFPPLKERRMVDIDGDNFNDVMQTVAPRVDLLPVLDKLPDLQASTDPLDKAIVFRAIEDFEPLRIVQALPALRAKYETRRQIRARQAEAQSGESTAMDAQVAAIDRELSAALSAIMHAPAFKAMERTWRGLFYFVSRADTGAMLKLRILNAGKDELRKDMEKAVEFDQSTLYKLLVEAEYGTYGGTPYSLLVGDYEFDHRDNDIGLLKNMSVVAAATHAPFIAAASCDLFGLPDYTRLDRPRELRRIFESVELSAWRAFRDTEDARYVALVLPRVLLRLPYGRPEKRNTIMCEGLDFEERLGEADTLPVLDGDGKLPGYPAPDHAGFLWGNAAYVLAERIARAFALYSWPAAISGVERGGLVEGLPLYTYAADAVTTELRCPTEVAISDRREAELRELGFIALCHCKGTDKAAFFGSPSMHAPKRYLSEEADDEARVSATLPYVLAASRFAHYVKVIMREKIGSFLTRANAESFLNAWIANYVLLDDNAAPEAKAAFPLRAANIVLSDVPGQPGTYRASIFLKPHFQLEERMASIRLTAALPA